MVVTRIVALGLILFARFATRKLQDIPTGAQYFWDWLVESLCEFLECNIGSELVKNSFWFFATIFLMIVVFEAVGVLEVVFILFRPVSLSFRLYGNIFAGENMLESMSTLVPGLGWLIAIPFYFLELLVGLAQALVFMLLTSVFTLLICTHEEGHETAHH